MRVVVAVSDLLARSRIEAAAVAAGHEVSTRRTVPPPEDPAPDLLVVDLDMPGALDGLRAWRATYPEAAVTGFAFHVNAEAIARANALGVRVVRHGADPAMLFG